MNEFMNFKDFCSGPFIYNVSMLLTDLSSYADLWTVSVRNAFDVTDAGLNVHRRGNASSYTLHKVAGDSLKL